MSHECCSSHDNHEGECCSTQAQGNGVEHPGVLDALGRDPERGDVVMVMLEHRPWNGGEKQLLQLQEKLNAYLSFALDGEMAEHLPQLSGLPLRIQLACAEPPPENVISLLEKVREQIAFQGVELEVVGIAPSGGGCGEGCGCHH